jgi:UDP-N-acetylmuramoyl-tripeptide--D-alanyl-D-alanine ligase
LLIDDSYNANPDSVRAAVDALAELPGPRALVLGDMGEVGEHEAVVHEEVLLWADHAGIDAIWLHGPACGRASRATGLGRHIEDIDELSKRLREWVSTLHSAGAAPCIWIKGSRFMRMERVVKALVSAPGEAVTCC